jgi:hypothetical protein
MPTIAQRHANATAYLDRIVSQVSSIRRGGELA